QNENESLVFLADGQEPQIFTTDNMERDIKKMISKHYVPIGTSSFNGELEDKDSVISQAKQLKAVAALYSWKYINTQTNTGVLTLPQTNYFSGTVNTFGSGANAFSTFNGSTTGMVSTPYSITQRRYDQGAVFFLKSTKRMKFGFIYDELSREQKIEVGQFGVVINNIYEDSAVHKSDVLIGDILFEVNGIKLQDRQHLDKILKEFDTSKGICHWKVLRNGQEKLIQIRF
ncbi:PDZ domain-containing protein, partial [Sulfuricurvum sp.]|uniref:PDZ domain-containing protein n=1 Tax=Sulfuricurvum sp. TaxID=2025608 RepID=UPI003BB7DD6E